MSVHKCPVCEGRGLVPAGFYYQNSLPTAVNTCPETCRSCYGKGVIFEYGGNDYNNPYTPYTNYPDDFKYESLVAMNSCSNCGHNDGMVYTSNPVKYKCTLTNEWHTADYKCDNWCAQCLKLFTGTLDLTGYGPFTNINATGTEDDIIESINQSSTEAVGRGDIQTNID